MMRDVKFRSLTVAGNRRSRRPPGDKAPRELAGAAGQRGARPPGLAAHGQIERSQKGGMHMMPQGSTFTTRPQLAGTFGMVASTHWLASAAGMAVLEQGGNAFDAAVAAGLVLGVVEPHMSGPAGEVPVIGFDAASGQPFVLDGQGPAPVDATLAAFPALGLDL